MSIDPEFVELTADVVRILVKDVVSLCAAIRSCRYCGGIRKCEPCGDDAATLAGFGGIGLLVMGTYVISTSQVALHAVVVSQRSGAVSWYTIAMSQGS